MIQKEEVHKLQKWFLPWAFFMTLVIQAGLMWVPIAVFYEGRDNQDFNTNLNVRLSYLVVLCLLAIDSPMKIFGSTYKDGVLLTGYREILPLYMGWHLLTDTLAFVGVLVQLLDGFKPLIVLFFFRIYSLRYYLGFIRIQLALRPSLSQAFNVFTAIVYYLLFANMASCFFFFIDDYLFNQQGQIYDNQQLWLVSAGAMPMIITWPLSVQYMYGMYWSLISAATIGYGDITPANYIEVLYAVAMFLIPNILFFSYMTGVTGTELQLRLEKRATKINKVASIHYMLQQRNTSRRYLHLISYYVGESLEISTDEQEGKQILNQLSKQLKEQLLYEMNKDAFRNISGLNRDLIVVLSELMFERTYYESEEVKPQENYFYVSTGRVKMMLGGLDTADFQNGKAKLRQFQKGSILNALNFLQDTKNPYVSYETLETTSLFSIRRQDLVDHEQFHRYELFLRTVGIALRLYPQKHTLHCQACQQLHSLTQCPLFVLGRRKASSMKLQLRRIPTIRLDVWLENPREEYMFRHRWKDHFIRTVKPRRRATIFPQTILKGQLQFK